jgi:two-component system OmpR family sensor kinase
VKSLRGRLLVVIGLVFVLGLVAADIATYSALQSFLYGRADQQLGQAGGLVQILNKVGALPPNFCAGPGPLVPWQVGANDRAEHPGGPPFESNARQEQAVQLLSPAGQVLDHQSCPAYVGGTPYLPATSHVVKSDTASQRSLSTFHNAPSNMPNGPEFRIRETVLSNGNRLVVAQPLGDIASTLHHLLVVELLVTLVAIVAALVGGTWLVRLGLRPLTSVEATAEAIANGDLSQRVEGESTTTEIGRLAGTLNTMLGKIEVAFKARMESERKLRRFVADASHELRTPVAAISAYSELFERGASENRNDLERLLAGIRRESQRMGVLINDLLLLTRLEDEQAPTMHPVDLVAICAEAVHVANVVGPEWPAAIEATQPIDAMGDETSLRQVVDNLLANVRAHTPPGTSVRVAVGGSDSGAVITVRDDGPGMDAEQASQIFERFFRTDPSRSRTHGGSGLGLAIVKAIVNGHGGLVVASSGVGQGLVVTVWLPGVMESRHDPTDE